MNDGRVGIFLAAVFARYGACVLALVFHLGGGVGRICVGLHDGGVGAARLIHGLDAGYPRLNFSLISFHAALLP